MKPCHIGQVSLGVVLIILFTLVSTCPAQESTDTDPVSGYVKRILELTPSFEQTWGELDELIRNECSAAMRADTNGLTKQENWLGAITRDAKIHYERALDDVRILLAGSDRVIERSLAKPKQVDMSLAFLLTELSDMRMEVAVVALINARVRVCIEKRRNTIGGEYWMTGSWQAKCTAAPGITPDTYGRITLQLLDKEVKGTVYPGADPVGAEVSGPRESYGSFALRTKEDRGQSVEVSGRFDQTYPLRGSGTIRLSGKVPDLGAWECIGIWKSD